MNKWIQKTSAVALKELDDKVGYVEAYANVYNILDSHKDDSQAGSFIKTVKEQEGKIFVYRNHDDNLLAGAPKFIDPYDSYGLFTGTQFNMDTDVGKNTFLDVKFMNDNGIPPPVSVAVWIMKRNQSKVTEQRLKEYSFLTKQQSNPLSFATSIKQENEELNILDIITKMYNVPYSDKRLLELETLLKSLETKPNGEEVINPTNGTTLLNDEPTRKTFFQIAIQK
ncbi:hypothetical protein ACR79B_20770 [Sphingobacterium spiritivorum]|uniref:hypothetical protein n=1 Tax=Sphingobacterium spiritivorum TaxID=258 RepID=UPI003DA41D54